MPRPPRQPRQRYVALLLGLIVVLAHGISAWHFGSELHRFCAEHGVVEHVADHGGHGHGDSSESGPSFEIPTNGEDEAHERCELGSYRREDPRHDTDPVEGRAVARAVARHSVCARSERFTQVELVLLAPGLSPPA